MTAFLIATIAAACSAISFTAGWLLRGLADKRAAETAGEEP